MQRRDLSVWIPLAILVAAVVVLFYRILIGEVLFWGLPSLQFYPWRWLVIEQLRDGQLPFWNPYNGGGTPLLANYQSAVLYPPNWLYFLIPGPRMMGLIALLHIVWAGLGMWHLTNKLGLSNFGRGVSLLCYALGSYTLGRLGSFPTAATAAWIPWLFWAGLRLWEHRRVLDVGILGLVTGLQLLAGHAQTSWYSFLALGLFALWYAIAVLRFSGWRTQFEALALSVMGMLLGAGIAVWQFLMTAEFLEQSHRAGGVSYESLTNLSYAPLRILTMFLPHLFGTPADGSYLTPDQGVYFEDAAYIGFVPLLATFFAVAGWYKWRNFLAHHAAFRTVPFWVFLSLTGFVLATGRYGPVYHFLYDYVPTFDNFREPVRWLIWPAFGLSILAGIGVQNWSRNQRAFFWTRLAATGAVAIIGVSLAASALLKNIDTDILNVLTTALITVGCWIIGAAALTLTQPTSSIKTPVTRWQAAVLLFIAVDLVWAVVGLNPTVPDDFYDRDLSISRPQSRLYWFEDYEQEVKFERYFNLSDYRPATDRWSDVRTSLLPNLNILDRITLFNNFDPLQPAVHRQYVELIEQTGEQSSSLLRGAAVGQVYGTVQPEGWQSGQGQHIYVAPQPSPQAWMVSEFEWVDNQQAAIDRLLSGDWNPEQLVVLQKGKTPEIEEPTFTQADVLIVTERPNERRYRITCDGAGFLVVANTWYPGWKVKVDGESVQLYQANVAFQAVYIPAGGADVRFTYTPRHTGISVIVSILAIFLTVALIAWGLFQEQLT